MTHAGCIDSVPVTSTPASEHGGTRDPVAAPRFLPVLGFTGFLPWLFAVPRVHAELGPHALLMGVSPSAGLSRPPGTPLQRGSS